MSDKPLEPMTKWCRLSLAAAVLAVVPLVAVTIRLALNDLFTGAGVLGDVVSSLVELTLLCVPLALPLGLAAIWRHATGPRRPGLVLALLATVVAGAELAFLVKLANTQF
ncbi:hypothetical protein [Nannocystis radixulma]|uniref:Uncharacterized protein n=1 Tax=Nannocystis radixulma TaxID=2995305 RepID=A0ABT5BGU3_9BACT|nr:hypothetical protein [Nannocystis radixulma]MDC0673361.1 hypothetical protein [Nannocystis radixulma]